MNNEQDKNPEETPKEDLKENFETMGFEDSNRNNQLSPGQIKSQNTKKQTLRRRGR